MSDRELLREAPAVANTEAERHVLGGVLLGGLEALTRVQALLAPSDYYHPNAQLIYRSLLTIAERNDPLDLVTLKDELLRPGTPTGEEGR